MELDALIELSKIISKTKSKSIDLLGASKKNKTLVHILYDNLVRGRFKNDEEATTFLFGEDPDRDSKYRKVKYRLIRQLVNTSFFIDTKQAVYTERQKAFFNSYKDFAASYLILLRSANKAGLYLLERVLEQAVKYEFVELATETTRFLRSQGLQIQASKPKIAKYKRLHQEYESKRRYQMIALDHFEDLLQYYASQKSPNKQIYLMASAFFEELMPLVSTVNTSQFIFHTYTIGAIKYFSVNDCVNALRVTEEALELLQPRITAGAGQLATLSIQKLACLTQLRQSEGDKKSLATVEYSLMLLKEGEMNWFVVHEQFFYNRIYYRDYEAALKAFSIAFLNERLQNMPESFKDKWRLHGGYMHLLARLGKIDLAEVEKVCGPFQYNRVLDEYEVLEKDRGGMNIPLVFLPILFGIITKAEDHDFGRSIEALEKYRQRYLSNNINKRSDYFMKMLLAYDRMKFDPVNSKRMIKRYSDLIKKDDPQVIGQNFAIEIIPYEDLWEMMTGKAL